MSDIDFSSILDDLSEADSSQLHDLATIHLPEIIRRVRVREQREADLLREVKDTQQIPRADIAAKFREARAVALDAVEWESGSPD